MRTLILFIVGLYAGVAIGFFTAALCSAAARGEQ
jgi:hypothetical protein